MKAKAPKKPKKPRNANRDKTSTKLLGLITAALADKKAADLRVLDVSKVSSITDYLVLATGNSEPHLRALRIELERVLDLSKMTVLGVDTTKGSGWTVVDAFEIMIHLFSPENRGKYRIESLWKDAVDVPLSQLVKRTAK